MDHWQYVILMAACVVVTLPLELVLKARVWAQPRRLLRALLLPFVVFVAWDMAATAEGVWSFEPRWTLGVTLPGGMAIEELLFFFVVPVCGLLTLEAVRHVTGERR